MKEKSKTLDIRPIRTAIPERRGKKKKVLQLPWCTTWGECLGHNTVRQQAQWSDLALSPLKGQSWEEGEAITGSREDIPG